MRIRLPNWDQARSEVAGTTFQAGEPACDPRAVTYGCPGVTSGQQRVTYSHRPCSPASLLLTSPLPEHVQRPAGCIAGRCSCKESLAAERRGLPFGGLRAGHAAGDLLHQDCVAPVLVSAGPALSATRPLASLPTAVNRQRRPGGGSGQVWWNTRSIAGNRMDGPHSRSRQHRPCPCVARP